MVSVPWDRRWRHARRYAWATSRRQSQAGHVVDVRWRWAWTQHTVSALCCVALCCVVLCCVVLCCVVLCCVVLALQARSCLVLSSAANTHLSPSSFIKTLFHVLMVSARQARTFSSSRCIFGSHQHSPPFPAFPSFPTACANLLPAAVRVGW